MIIADCPGCQMGNHDDHVEHWGKRPEGVIDGEFCYCTGSCAGRKSPFDFMLDEALKRTPITTLSPEAQAEHARLTTPDKTHDEDCAGCHALMLLDRAEAAEQQVVALDRLLAEAINAHRDLHRIYPSTSACLGGISGQAMTPHCGEVCRNSDKHTSENDRWERVERAYFRRRDGDPKWADLDAELES